ncbi:ROK family protein [Actinomyces howellii]|uniref:Glucokinase n=1 Tax=Actinomyces howellii TaxID=52771 RepID=A0A448HIF0_9ACTO|nr:ROK family protein [Actinomyces howellii]VEG29271.1 Glucokinase [Actinomyces howellii]
MTPDDVVGSEADEDTSLSRGPRRPLSFVHVAQLSDLIEQARRFPQGVSRSDLAETLSMGRNAVDRRLRTAVEMNLLEPAGRGASTGGRAPEMWRFNPGAATMLALVISYRQSTAALMTLGGEVLERRTWEEGLLQPPSRVLTRAAALLSELRTARPDLPGPWALGVSLPVPVDFRDGSLVLPVTGAGTPSQWTSYPLRTRLARHLSMSVWVDDEVNALALAAASRVGAPSDILYVRISLGLGMGIVSNGQVHRGAGAASGEIAHIQLAGTGGERCRCGRQGCLETVISGAAIEREARAAHALRGSPYLREVMSERDTIVDSDVFRGVAEGDRVCVRIVSEAADRLSGILAVLITTYNPGEVVLGGTVALCGPQFAHTVGQSIRRRVLPVTAERLRVRIGDPDDALVGANRLAAERVLSPHVLQVWLPHGSPAGVEELITHRRQDA